MRLEINYLAIFMREINRFKNIYMNIFSLSINIYYTIIHNINRTTKFMNGNDQLRYHNINIQTCYKISEWTYMNLVLLSANGFVSDK